jgi:hypothetical protein
LKELLIEYIDLITANVSRHTPAIAARIVRGWAGPNSTALPAMLIWSAE